MCGHAGRRKSGRASQGCGLGCNQGSKGSWCPCSRQRGGRALEGGVSRGAAGRLGQPRTGLNWAPESCPHFLGARLIMERCPSSRDLDAKPVKTRRGVVHLPRGCGWGVRPPPPWPPAHRPREGSLPCPRWPRGSGGAHAAPVPSPRVLAGLVWGKRDSGAAGRQESGKASWGRCCVPWALAAGLQGDAGGWARWKKASCRHQSPQRAWDLAHCC